MESSLHRDGELVEERATIMTTIWQVIVFLLTTVTACCFALGDPSLDTSMDSPLPVPDCASVPGPKGSMSVSAVVVFFLGGQFALYHKNGLTVLL